MIRLPQQLTTLLRKPLPAQALTIIGSGEASEDGSLARIVGECGTGKTLMSIGVAHTHAEWRALLGDRDVPAAPGAEVGARSARSPCRAPAPSSSTTCAMEATQHGRMASSKCSFAAGSACQ